MSMSDEVIEESFSKAANQRFAGRTEKVKSI